MKNTEKSLSSFENQKQNLEDVKGGKRATLKGLNSDKKINEDIIKGGVDRPIGGKAATSMKVDKPTTHRS